MSKVLVVYCLLYDDKDNRVLMVYNKDTESWSLPGGVVEDTETLEQAVLREVHEETDLMVEIKDLVAVNEYIFPDNRQHTVLFTFRGEIVGGDISVKRPDEVSDIVWMDISRADELMPYYRSGISKLIQNSADYINQCK